ncbi:hypothetical protein FW774_06445 [Pedobacter sp. BS3]|uniref:DUF6364 family protein n=1 Tax=Pedobacter sp. BS3 TaxID=2567937 RepID=UPI0011EEA8CA|nr:DUF6364 family protein [Pedobacter sp. BS3]TZF84622.1 hypothetical protein FW774_06445 [Pedobacter sp. BS3]
MDTKVTLSFDEEVVRKAKKYAADNNISLSRLIEFLLTKVTTKEYANLEEYPISDWVYQVAEGEVEYKRAPKNNEKSLKHEFFESKK